MSLRGAYQRWLTKQSQESRLSELPYMRLLRMSTLKALLAMTSENVIARSPSPVIARHEVPKQSQNRLGMNSATKQSLWINNIIFIL